MRSRHGALPYREFVYDHDPSEVEVLRWEEFIARQWESIFAGYRSWVGLRRMGRRWDRDGTGQPLPALVTSGIKGL